MTSLFCRGWSDLDKISEAGAEYVDCGDMAEVRSKFQYGGRLGEFNGMSSQSHVSHCCRVLPLGEFTVTIPEPHATLQGAVTWRNQCHDRATVQGVRIPSAILKIVFRYILFCLFLMQFIVSDTLVLFIFVVTFSFRFVLFFPLFSFRLSFHQ